ncbi:Phosphoglucosamine mutase, partial [Bienertia sinuspersici]
MYVTRPLSLYKSHPEFLSVQPSQIEGPNSGYLIIQDEQDFESSMSLPFPQNKLFTIAYEYSTGGPGSSNTTKKYDVAFIPAINQPLSSNCYYVIAANGDKKGLAYRSATEEDNESCCFCYDNIPNKEPEEFNPYNIYQQFEIFKTREGRFSSRSIDPEGYAPDFLQKPQSITLTSKGKNFTLGEADGLNSVLRSQLADFDFPLSKEHSQSKIVGKWLCPFMFVVEGSVTEQMERSMFYELTLEQQWERIYYSSNKRNAKVGYQDSVAVNVVVPTESVKISWMDSVSERDEANNMMWFWVISEIGLQTRIGLSLMIVERMMWEQERVGWVHGNEKQVMVARMERYTGGDSWREFGCYVLVERPLSLYKNSPEALAQPPPKGPNSGYLVLQDEESATTVGFGLCKNRLTTDLPFPQNKSLAIQHQFNDIINQPLSFNQYYAIKNQGKSKGYIKDQKKRVLDPNDKAQQFALSHRKTCTGITIFHAKTVAANSYPPTFMRAAGWNLWNSEPKHFTLADADGINPALRARLPMFNFPPSEKCSKFVGVGKWYTPLMFVKESTPKKHMKRSMFYEVKLVQKWERIFYSENNGNKGNIVSFDVIYLTESVAVNGKEAKECSKERVGGMLWFRAMDYNGEESRIGLSLLVVERMFWKQERVGWSNNKEKQVKLTGVEEYSGVGYWKKFGCYLLVE